MAIDVGGEVALFIVLDIYFTVVLFLFFKRRNLHPITGRTFSKYDILLMASLALAYLVQINANITAINGEGCNFALNTSAVSATIPLNLIIRAYWLLQQYRISSIYKNGEEKARIKMGNLKKRKLSFMIKLTLSIYGTFILTYIIAYLSGYKTYSTNCGGAISPPPTSPGFLILNLFYIIVLITIIVFLIQYIRQKVTDAFSIKKELFTQACVQIASTVFILVLTFLNPAIASIAFETLGFTVNFTWPLLSSFIRRSPVSGKIKLEIVLEDPIYLSAFIDYCVSEFSTEQPLFYGEYREFKNKFNNAKNDEARQILVQSTYNKYFQEDSVLQINVDDKIKTNLDRKMAQPFTEDIFDEAAAHVIETMNLGTYRRWTKTREFHNLNINTV